MKCSVVFLVLLSLGASAPAWANLRAPKEYPGQISSALYPSPALEVQKEELSLGCDGNFCDVQAVYHLQAERAASVDLEFILPLRAEVEARLGDTRLEVAATEETELTPQEAQSVKQRDSLGYHEEGEVSSLYRARFQAALPAGASTLTLRYRQRVAAREADYGYFVDSRFVRSVQYEVWPIKQWRRSPDFTLELEIRLKNEDPGWWASTFGTLKGLVCVAGDQGHVLRGQQQGDALVLRQALRSLPDQLVCHMGDEDLLPGAPP